jgi:hypothetical protein
MSSRAKESIQSSKGTWPFFSLSLHGFPGKREFQMSTVVKWQQNSHISIIFCQYFSPRISQFLLLLILAMMARGHMFKCQQSKREKDF